MRALISTIQEAEFQPKWRRNDFGDAVRGWPQRLERYFWPTPRVGYSQTAEIWKRFTDAARPLSEKLESGACWSDRERCEALVLAEWILEWGRVPQRNYDSHTVETVFLSALEGSRVGGAPMNSGWTKVAAFATAHREGHLELYPHTIWDSRVSTSVVSRLDALLAADGVEDPRELFPGVGFVPGRGGKRERLDLELRWPNVYRRWSGHFVGSALVKEIRDLINTSSVPPMPTPDGGETDWTIMGVGNVLFMDGY